MPIGIYPRTKPSYPRPSALQRFVDGIKVLENGCWEWQGCKDGKGYGEFRFNGKKGKVHRFIYEYFNNITIPQGLEIDHLCRNHSCVNPDHLEVVTSYENIMRGFGVGAKNSRKTHCLRGHLFNQQNTYYHKDGRRECRNCHNARQNSMRKQERATIQGIREAGE